MRISGGCRRVIEALDLSDIKNHRRGRQQQSQERLRIPTCHVSWRAPTNGAVLAKGARRVPFFEFSHQQGHIAAAALSAADLVSAHRTDLMEDPAPGVAPFRRDDGAALCQAAGNRGDLRGRRRHNRHFSRSAHRQSRPAYRTEIPVGQGAGRAGGRRSDER